MVPCKSPPTSSSSTLPTPASPRGEGGEEPIHLYSAAAQFRLGKREEEQQEEQEVVINKERRGGEGRGGVRGGRREETGVVGRS